VGESDDSGVGVRGEAICDLQNDSGKHKIVSRDQMMHWIFVLVQKASNAKKESFCSAEP